MVIKDMKNTHLCLHILLGGLFFFFFVSYSPLSIAQPSAVIANYKAQEASLELKTRALEKSLDEKSRYIDQLKSQSPGIGRDGQLATALREHQQMANQLTNLRQEIRLVRQRLLSAYEQAISRASNEQTRAQLEKDYNALTRNLTNIHGMIITREQISPLDSPEDLDAKADLLADSQEKVRRQIQLLENELRSVQHRARLKRHSRAADDNPFVEESPRRTALAHQSVAPAAKTGTAGTASGAPNSSTAGKATQDESSAGIAGGTPGGTLNSAPTPPTTPTSPTTPTITSPSPSLDSSSTGTIAFSVREVMDPQQLLAPTQKISPQNLPLRIAALQEAKRKFDQLNSQLDQQTRLLRERAQALRNKK